MNVVEKRKWIPAIFWKPDGEAKELKMLVSRVGGISCGDLGIMEWKALKF